MAKQLTIRQLREMSADKLDEYLAGEVAIIHVDNQARFRIIQSSVTPPHDDNQRKTDTAKAKTNQPHVDNQATPAPAKANTAPRHDDNQRDALPPGVQRYYPGKRYPTGTLVMLRNGEIIEAPELDADGRPVPMV